MYTIGAFEAKTHFSSLLEDVENGEQIIITKHGRAVAKLSPIVYQDKEGIREAIKKLKNLQQQNILGMDWKELRDEGRK